MRLFLLASLLWSGPSMAGDEEAAVVMVERAVAAYEAGEYEKAGSFFLEAFELSALPNQLRNAAKAFQRAEQLDRAQALWERYLGLEGTSAAERNEAKAQIALILEKKKSRAAREDAARARSEADAARLEAKTSTPAIVKTPILEHSSPLPVGPIVTFSVAGAAAIASLWLFFHSSTKLGNLDDELSVADSDGLIVGISRGDAEEELDDVNRERAASAVLVGLAGAAAVAGTLWLILTPSHAPAPVVSVTEHEVLMGIAGAF